ncbi:MAG: F0F1 ATP synthase subunit B [Fimbriimonadales bacterium]
MSEKSTTNSGAPWYVTVISGLIIAAIGVVLGQHWELHLPGEMTLHFGKTVTAMGIFVAVMPLIKMFYTTPMWNAINDRNTNLENTFGEAESLKQRMTDLKASYEKKLADSEAEARDQIQTALAEAQEMKARIIDEARTQAEEVKARADEELRRERSKMLVDLRSHVVDLTMTATRKVIGESVDETKQRELVERFIETAEVGN